MCARTSLNMRLEKESAAHMTVCVSSELAGDHVLRVSSELARCRPRCVFIACTTHDQLFLAFCMPSAGFGHWCPLRLLEHY